MNNTLSRYDHIKEYLGFLVADTENRTKDLKEVNRQYVMQRRRNTHCIQSFRTSVFWVTQYIDDFEQLKRAIRNSLYKYVEGRDMKK
jgi:hypothetical protein